MQKTERALSHQRFAVFPYSPNAFRNPHRVSTEQLIVLYRAQMTGCTQLHHKIVYQLLHASFVQYAPRHIPREINIQKCADTA